MRAAALAASSPTEGRMRRLHVLAPATLATLATLAPGLSCTLPTEPITIEFDIERQGILGAVAPAVTVEGPRRIDAVGSLRTPCLPYDATGSLSHESRTLTLTVIGHSSGACAQDAVGMLVYRAAIKRLPPGNYTVRLVHTYRDAPWPTEVVLRQRLRVE
jgi:hypothetical protein